ncbi:MAG TPA: hypothetical protein VEY30_14160 [Myxococcaceae bacterium]|nr:hypothetical protein [Myxococcaceae bacterium]
MAFEKVGTSHLPQGSTLPPATAQFVRIPDGKLQPPGEVTALRSPEGGTRQVVTSAAIGGASTGVATLLWSIFGKGERIAHAAGANKTVGGLTSSLVGRTAAGVAGGVVAGAVIGLAILAQNKKFERQLGKKFEPQTRAFPQFVPTSDFSKSPETGQRVISDFQPGFGRAEEAQH